MLEKIITSTVATASVVTDRLASMVRFLFDRVYLNGPLDAPNWYQLEVFHPAQKDIVEENLAVIEACLVT